MTFIDLTGQKFGHLTVMSRSDKTSPNSKRKRIWWNCVCECGNTAVVLGDNLKSGKSISCGCFRKELMSKRQSVHKESKTKLYGIWCSMKNRCYNPNVKFYERYGGRGITVCDEWRTSYESFRDWALDNGYAEHLSIDRVNNDGNYEPSNCRWATAKEQANNRCSNKH